MYSKDWAITKNKYYNKEDTKDKTFSGNSTNIK